MPDKHPKKSVINKNASSSENSRIHKKSLALNLIKLSFVIVLNINQQIHHLFIYGQLFLSDGKLSDKLTYYWEHCLSKGNES
jgi:hypothetical protein